MPGQNTGKMGSFSSIQQIRDAKKKAEADRKRKIEKDRKEIAKNKNKKKKGK